MRSIWLDRYHLTTLVDTEIRLNGLMIRQATAGLWIPAYKNVQFDNITYPINYHRTLKWEAWQENE